MIGIVPRMQRAVQIFGNMVFIITVSLKVVEIWSGNLLLNFCNQYVPQMSISGRSSRYIWANPIKFTTFTAFPITDFHNYTYTRRRLSSEELKTLDIVFDNAAFVRVQVMERFSEDFLEM